MPGSLAPLGYRNFALYWVGLVTSNSGRWIEITGVVWLLSGLTASPFLLGLVGVVRTVPALVLGPISGTIADRVDQRRLLFVTQGLSLLASLCLGLLIASGAVQTWHVYLQVAVQAAIEPFDVSVRQALFPRLVPRGLRSESVTLTSTAARAAKLVGPSVGGIAIAHWGPAAPFFINAGSFLALMAAVAWIRGVVPRTAAAGSSLRQELIDGIRYIARAPILSGLLTLEGAFSFFGVNAVIITVIAREVLAVGPEGLGGLLAAGGLGSLIGISALLAFGHPRHQGRFVLACTIAYAASLVLFAASRDYMLSFAALALLGLFDVLVSVTRMSVMQLIAPARMRGRVMGNVRMVSAASSQLSQTQSGVMAGAFGGPLAIVAAACALATAAAVTTRIHPALWHFSRDG